MSSYTRIFTIARHRIIKLAVVLFAASLLQLPDQIFAAENNSATILLYHHVAVDTPPSTTISPDDFRAHLEYLRNNEFNVLPLNEIVESLRQQQSIPDKSVAITFDDGYLSIYETAFPMLQEFGMPFTLFVSTDPIDQGLSNYMSWQQIREMSDAGVIIANHLLSHPHMLERLANESDEERLARIRGELLQAEALIEEHTAQNHRYLAYTYGEFDLPIKDMLAAENFTGFAQNSGAIGWDSDFLALPRFPLASIYANLDTARIKMDSLAFSAELVEPLSPVTRDTSPAVTLRFNDGDYNRSQIGCFANSQAMNLDWLDREQGLVRISTEQQFSSRRWRYLCTAPAPGSNRYYWYSVQWINPDKPE